MWIKALFVCILGIFTIVIADTGTLTCSSPPEYDDSVLPDLEGTEYAIGTSFTYSCNFGYVSRNSFNHISTCVNVSGKAEWTVPEISCIPRSCGDPGYINNGRRIGNLFTFPNKITFECDEGYKIQGMNERYCQASGEWSGRLPSCELIYCSEPSDPENGRVKYSSLEYGTELLYQCNVGYMLEKHEPRYCSEDESWSNVEPKCTEVRCEKPIAPDHGRVQLNGDPTVGSTVIYSCDEDKVMKGEKISKCLTSGQWTYAPPKCLSYCIVPDIKYGEIGRITITISRSRKQAVFKKISSGAQVDSDPHDKLTLRCAGDYLPFEDEEVFENNQAEMICNNGTWSRIPQCRKTSCEEEPPTMERGQASIGSRKHGFSIWYKCDDWRDKKNDGNVTCHFGKWIGITPQCLSSPCITDQLNYPGLVKPSKKFIASSDSVDIKCKEGFRLATSARSIKCNGGIWNITQNQYCLEDVIQEKSNSTIFSELESKQIVKEKGSESSTHRISQLELIKECYCTYHRADYNIRATARGKPIKDGDKIKQGETVTFECLYPRFLEWENGLVISDKSNYTCTTCQIWEKTHNPKCTLPKEGQPFMVFDTLLKMKPRGVAEIEAGKSIALFCGSSNKYPEWFFRGEGVKNVHHSAYEGEVSILYSYIIISNAADEHSGIYECITRSDSADKDLRSVLNLQVKGFSCLTKELNYTGLVKPVLDSLRHLEFFNISCEKGFKKTSSKSVISCIEGQWNATENPCTKEIKEVRIIPTVPPVTTATRVTLVHLTTRPSVGALALTIPVTSNNQDTNECYCTYERDGSIRVGAEDKILKYGDKVRVGETVSFQCIDAPVLTWANGLRVFGVAKVTCSTACEKWRNSRNPACSLLDNGVPFVVLAHQLKLQSKGIAEVDVGQSFQLLCGSTYYYPDWYLPDSSLARGQNRFKNNNQILVFYTSIFINASSEQINGKYKCTVSYYGTTTLEIQARIPGCSIAHLYDSLSRGVIPDMARVTEEFIPLGSTMQLACENNLVSKGNSTVKCKRNGKWQMGNFQCFPGCLLKLQESSSLEVVPRQDSYRFGEHIILSCPEEEELTSDVKRLMCLGETGWSHPIPDCKKKK